MVTVLVDGVIYAMQAHGGIGRCFAELLRRVGDGTHDARILLHLPRPVLGEPPRAAAVEHVRDWRLGPASVFRAVSRAANGWRLRRQRPGVFHSTYYTPSYWPRLPSVVTVHDFIDEHLFDGASGNPPGFIERKRAVIESADAVVAVSQATKADVLRFTGVVEEKISVVYHGVDPCFAAAGDEDVSEFTQRHGLDRPYWLFVGRRHRYKNFGAALRAWERFGRSEHVRTFLVAIGPDAELAPWEYDFAVRHGLERSLRLLVRVDEPTLAAAYRGATAFVFPSLIEGFGIPLLEAMAYGTPILAADIPAFREVAESAAIYFDPHDPESLAAAMSTVMDEEVRDVLASNARRRAKSFSWDRSAEQLLAIYRRLA